MIEIVIAFIIWGLVCYRIGFNRGVSIGIIAGVNTTVQLASKVITIGQIQKITELANKMTVDIIKQKTGQ